MCNNYYQTTALQSSFAERGFFGVVLCNAIWMCDTGMSRDAPYVYCYWAGNTLMHTQTDTQNNLCSCSWIGPFF